MNTNTLSFLVISDIHRKESWEWLKQRLDKEINENQFDFILNGGDLTYIAYDKEQAEEEKKEKRLLFEKIKSELDNYGIHHLYVPGNHDPEKEYENSYSTIELSSENSINIDKKCIQINPHLWIIGCGGSVPNTLENGEMISTGYPYEIEDMKEGISKSLASIPPDDQVIILTHNPPSHIGSSFMDYRKKKEEIGYYGSETLYKEVTEGMKDHNIFLFIHGHVHHEPGMNWIHRHGRHCCIVNPGAVMGGKYAKIKLEYKNEKWNVVNVHHSFYTE